YVVFRQRLGDDTSCLTLAELGSLGRNLGFRLVPVKMSVADLANAGVPVIVHFEEVGIDSGRFQLFLGMARSEAMVALIDGSHVTRVQMSGEEFRRRWTGYGLIAQPSTGRDKWGRRCALALVICATGLCLAYRAGALGQRQAPPAPRAPQGQRGEARCRAEHHARTGGYDEDRDAPHVGLDHGRWESRTDPPNASGGSGHGTARPSQRGAGPL